MATTLSALVVALAVVGQGGKSEVVFLVPHGIFNKDDAERFQKCPPDLFRTEGGRSARIRLEFGKSPKRLWDDPNVRYVVQVIPKATPQCRYSHIVHVGDRIVERPGHITGNGPFNSTTEVYNITGSYILTMRTKDAKQPETLARGKLDYDALRMSPLDRVLVQSLPDRVLHEIWGDLGSRLFSERWQALQYGFQLAKPEYQVFQKKLVVRPTGGSAELRATNKLPVAILCDFEFYANDQNNTLYSTREGRSGFDLGTFLKPGDERSLTFELAGATAASANVLPKVKIYDPELAPVGP